MRHLHTFGLSAAFGATLIAALAADNTLLALAMGAALGCTVAVMILGFPLDLSYREPPRGKQREVHVVMVSPDQKRR
jgi:hypothetical protein